MASIKAQQEAFSKKGQKTEEDIAAAASPVRGNLAVERIASIKAQQEAFSKKGQKNHDENEEKEEEPLTGVKAAASKFGDTAKPKSAVQKRMEALEQRQKEEAMKNDPKAYQEVSWGTGQGHGKFKKETKDSRGIAPKKNFTDLP
jgi:hypothetical protein